MRIYFLILLLVSLTACATAAGGDSTPSPLPTAALRPPGIPAGLPSPTPEILPLPGGVGTPLPGVVEPLPGAGRAVQIPLDDGTEVSAFFYTSQDAFAEGPAPALLLAPMQGAARAAWGKLPHTAAQRGFAVLELDLVYSGLPDSSEMLEAQASAALDWLTSQREVDAERIYGVGASLGANLILELATGDERLKGAVLISPVTGDYGIPLPESLRDLPPALLIIAAQDDPFSLSDTNLPLGGRAELIRPEGKAHGANLLSQDPGLVEEIVDWLAQR